MDLFKQLFPLNYDYINKYVISSTIPLLDTKHLIFITYKSLIQSLFEVIVSLSVLLLYIVLVLCKLSVIIFPYALLTINTIITWHKTQLTMNEIIIEVTLIFIIILLLIFHKTIRNLWIKLELNVSTKFKLFIRTLPHILFFTISIFITIVGKKFILPLTSFKVLPIISIIIPTIVSTYILFEHSNNIKTYSLLRKELLKWIVLMVYHSIATVLSYIPFSKKVLYYIPYVREFFVIILIWIQLSHIFASIVFDISLPILISIEKKIPTVITISKSNNDSNSTYLSSIFITLKYMKVITIQQEKIIKSIIHDGIALLFVLLFILTPTYVAIIGVVIVMYVLPIFKTFQYIYINDEIIITPKKHEKTNKKLKNFKNLSVISNDDFVKENVSNIDEDSLQSSGLQLKRWLKYWILIGIVIIVNIYVITIWPSILLLLTFWLQNTYFDGASYVFNKFTGMISILKERHHNIEKERLLLNDKIDDDSVSKRLVYDENVYENENDMLVNINESNNDTPNTINKRHLSKKRK